MKYLILSALCASTFLMTSCNKSSTEKAEVEIVKAETPVKKSLVLGDKNDKDKAQKYTIGCGNCIFENDSQEEIHSLWIKSADKTQPVSGVTLSDGKQLSLCKAAHAQQAFISGVKKDGKLEATYIEILPDPHNH